MPYSDKEYNNSPIGKRRARIWKWKSRGIIDADYDALYDLVLATNECQICNKYIEGINKQVDHDHSITDGDNVRYICCLRCNTTFLKEKIREDNTSGHIGISWREDKQSWRVRWQVDGKEQCKSFKDKNDAIEFNNTIDRS